MSKPESTIKLTSAQMRKCNVCADEAPTFLFKKGIYEIFKCKKCGLVFRSTLPSENELESLYSEELFTDEARKKYYIDDDGTNRGNAHANLKIVEHHKKGKRILDIGCAFGSFLATAKKNGWEAWGNEISLYATEHARKNLGTKILSGDFLKAELPMEYFDVVTMWDYIEHVCDPNKNVLKARALLTQGGMLFISTGNISSFFAKLLGKRWKLIKPEQHLYYFAPETLSKLLGKAGLEVIAVMHRGRYFNLEYLIKSSQREYHGSIVKTLCDIFLGFSKAHLLPKRIYVNLGDIMTVVAKKS